MSRTTVAAGLDTTLPFIEEFGEKLGHFCGDTITKIDTVHQFLQTLDPGWLKFGGKLVGGYINTPASLFRSDDTGRALNNLVNQLIDRFFTGLGKGLADGSLTSDKIRNAADRALADTKAAAGRKYYITPGRMGPYSFYHDCNDAEKPICYTVIEDMAAFAAAQHQAVHSKVLKKGQERGEAEQYPGETVSLADMPVGYMACLVCNPWARGILPVTEAEKKKVTFGTKMGDLSEETRRGVHEFMNVVAISGTRSDNRIVASILTSDAMGIEELMQFGDPDVTLPVKLMLCRSLGGAERMSDQFTDFVREARKDMRADFREARDWATDQFERNILPWAEQYPKFAISIILIWFAAGIGSLVLMFASFTANLLGPDSPMYDYCGGVAWFLTMGIIFCLSMLGFSTIEDLINVPLQIVNGILKIGAGFFSRASKFIVSVFSVFGAVDVRNGEATKAEHFNGIGKLEYFRYWRFTPLYVISLFVAVFGWNFGFAYPHSVSENLAIAFFSGLAMGFAYLSASNATRPKDLRLRPLGFDEDGKPIPDFVVPPITGLSLWFRRANLIILLVFIAALIGHMFVGTSLNRNREIQEAANKEMQTIMVVDEAGNELGMMEVSPEPATDVDRASAELSGATGDILVAGATALSRSAEQARESAEGGDDASAGSGSTTTSTSATFPFVFYLGLIMVAVGVVGLVLGGRRRWLTNGGLSLAVCGAILFLIGYLQRVPPEPEADVTEVAEVETPAVATSAPIVAVATPVAAVASAPRSTPRYTITQKQLSVLCTQTPGHELCRGRN